MPKIKLGDVEFEAPEQTIQAFNKALKDAEAEAEKAKEEASKAKDEGEDLQKKCDELQAKLDAAMEELEKAKKSTEDKTCDAAIEAKVQERAAVLKKAAAHLGDADTSKLSVLEIKRKAVETACKIDLKDKSADYIAARFDAMAEKAAPAAFRDHAAADGEKSTKADELPLSERRRLAKLTENKANLKKG